MSTIVETALVIDDDSTVRDTLREILLSRGIPCDVARDGHEGLALARKRTYCVAIVDEQMPGLSGLETIRKLKALDNDIEVIIYTAYPSLDKLRDGVREQVFDFLVKPADVATLMGRVRNALERRRLILHNRELTQHLTKGPPRFKTRPDPLRNNIVLVGQSEAARGVRHAAESVGRTDMTVLILGESGSGKDVVASLIHHYSGRDPNLMVKINCPAIPETLLESELFGHEAGAFTSADRQRLGMFEIANGGTLFLDEIGDLPIGLQAKLLQAIEKKQFRRLGSNKAIESDVRIIAATNAPVEKMIAEGTFRPDLFYRLNEYAIHVPPLRKRMEDVPLLAEYFLRQFRDAYDSAPPSIPPDVANLMQTYTWPGNVRELRTIIKRFVMDGEPAFIRQTLSARIQEQGKSLPPPAAPAQPEAKPEEPDVFDSDFESDPLLGCSLERLEAEAIRQALQQTCWNRRKAAELLGIGYYSLRRRIDKYDIDKEPAGM